MLHRIRPGEHASGGKPHEPVTDKPERGLYGQTRQWAAVRRPGGSRASDRPRGKADPEGHGGRPGRFARWRAALAPALNLALFGAALWAVDHVLREYRWSDVRGAL